MFDLDWFYNPVCFLCAVWRLLWAQICLTAPREHFFSILKGPGVRICEKCKNSTYKPVVTCTMFKLSVLCASQIKTVGFHSQFCKWVQRRFPLNLKCSPIRLNLAVHLSLASKNGFWFERSAWPISTSTLFLAGEGLYLNNLPEANLYKGIHFCTPPFHSSHPFRVSEIFFSSEAFFCPLLWQGGGIGQSAGHPLALPVPWPHGMPGMYRTSVDSLNLPGFRLRQDRSEKTMFWGQQCRGTLQVLKT